jgi:murein L,D-transpeptidase YcbB/YkuD
MMWAQSVSQRVYQVTWLLVMLLLVGLTARPVHAEENAAQTPLAAAPEAPAPASSGAANSAAGQIAPDTPGSPPKDAVENRAVAPVVPTAATPDQSADPVLETSAPATAIVSPPASATPGPPAGPDGSGASGTPAVVVVPAVVSLADRLHAALDASMAMQIKGRDAAEIRKLRLAVAAFYAERNYAPLWIENGKPNEAARAALAQLARASDDGLSVDEFPAPVFGQSGGGAGDGQDLGQALGDDKLIAADINLTVQVAAYGREASGGRVEPQRIAALIGAKPAVAEPAQILAVVAAAGADAGSVLKGFNPQQAGYRALRDKLAELRHETKPVTRRPVPPDPVQQAGGPHQRVRLIRTRGVLDAAATETQEPSSGRMSRLETEVLANMEMWRWMPRDFGKDRIEVNIPDFTVAVFRADEPVWRSKVIVGKPQTATPVFSNVMRFLIVNPYWNIPPSIIRKEFGSDPAALRRHGYQVSYRQGHLIARQPPGERNALGRIKFMFPNDYAVYLHDTPSRNLFGAAQRAFSHGCVRVDQPFGFAQAVLGPDSGWSEARVKHLIGGGERYVNLPEPLPIYLEYFTAFVDAEGHLQLRDDIYGYTRKLDIALGLEK